MGPAAACGGLHRLYACPIGATSGARVPDGTKCNEMLIPFGPPCALDAAGAKGAGCGRGTEALGEVKAIPLFVGAQRQRGVISSWGFPRASVAEFFPERVF